MPVLLYSLNRFGEYVHVPLNPEQYGRPEVAVPHGSVSRMWLSSEELRTTT